MSSIQEGQLWRRAIDKKNRTYFFNIVTQESSWHPPVGFQPDEIPFAGVSGSYVTDDAALATNASSTHQESEKRNEEDDANVSVAKSSTETSPSANNVTSGRSAIKAMLLQAEKEALAAEAELEQADLEQQQQQQQQVSDEVDPSVATTVASNRNLDSKQESDTDSQVIHDHVEDDEDADNVLADALMEYEKATELENAIGLTKPSFDPEAYDEDPQFSPLRVERPSGSWIQHNAQEEEGDAEGIDEKGFVLQKPRRGSIFGEEKLLEEELEIREAATHLLSATEEDLKRNQVQQPSMRSNVSFSSQSMNTGRRGSLANLPVHFALDTTARLNQTRDKAEKQPVIPWNSRRASLVEDQNALAAAEVAAKAGIVGFSYPNSQGLSGTTPRTSRSVSRSLSRSRKLAEQAHGESDESFYEREKRWREERSRRQAEKLEQLESEFKETHTFKPRMSSTTAKLLTESAEARQRLFAAKRAKKTEVLAMTLEEEKLKECTFQPKINPASARIASGRPSFIERVQLELVQTSEEGAQELAARRSAMAQRPKTGERLAEPVSAAQYHDPETRAKFQPEIVGVKQDMTSAAEYTKAPVWDRLATTHTAAYNAYAAAAKDTIVSNPLSPKHSTIATRNSRRSQFEREEALQGEGASARSNSQSQSRSRIGQGVSASRDRGSQSRTRSSTSVDGRRRSSTFAPSSAAFASSSGRRGESVYYQDLPRPNPEALNPTDEFNAVVERLKQRQKVIEERLRKIKEKQEKETEEKRKFKVSDKTAKILDHSGINTASFDDRVLVSVQAKERAGEVAAVRHNVHANERFKPFISSYSQQLPARSVDDLVYGDQIRRRQLLQEMRQLKEEEESREMTFSPDLSRSQKPSHRTSSSGSLLARSNMEDYQALIRSKEQDKQALAEAKRIERERLEIEACTFRPRTKPVPQFIVEQAQAAKARRAETPKNMRPSKPAWQ